MTRVRLLTTMAVLVFCTGAAADGTADTNALFISRLTSAAVEQTGHAVRYVPGYVKIAYPNGDVPASTGVCTDVIIRAFRAAGVDLQKEVHEDISRNFDAYPRVWGLKRPDSNIDHRRVPNLAAFFRRHGLAIAPTRNPSDYLPGDLVTWDLGRGVPHIGIVVGRSADSQPLLVHNIGNGPQREAVLFDWKITGHFRFTPATRR
ncbi:MAG: DUF1287 domain-containing protein [Acidobacteriota bacterium]